ncbi:methyl-accepting chemotaxis protein [Rummeliibacillus pycnus]|uniref:methyl-accepting chemotaxis protein n=1 Tax=Rummeliibacillus pycnus TaxID=101070 RepID=UPI0037C6C5ED
MSRKHNVSFRTMLMAPIILIIILSSAIIAYVSYDKNKKVIIHSVEQQMLSSAEVINQKITMLKSTTTKEQFDHKLSYALTQTRNSFKSSELTPMQFKIAKEGKVEPFNEFKNNIPKISNEFIKKLYQQKNGIVHYNGVTYALAFQMELDESVYVIALNDEEYLKPVYNYRNILIGITFLTVLIASIIGFIMISKVTKPVHSLKKLMDKVSEGDFQTRIKIGQSSKEIYSLSVGFNQMVDRLQSLMTHLELSAKQVTQSSDRLKITSSESRQAIEQISMAIEEVAGGTEVQVESATLASRQVSDISIGMNDAGQCIHSVENSVNKALGIADSGNKLVNNTVEQISLVERTVENTAAMLESLQLKSKDIDQILNLISEISTLTNLLSLNATIEAARAGEHGKGFAVVAQEVRKLSDQSEQAVMQIKEITDKIRKETDEVALSMNQGLEVLKEGIIMVNQTEESFKDIVNAVRNSTHETNDVSSIVADVSIKTKNMVNRMEEISSISGQFAGTMQHISAVTEEQQASMDNVSDEAIALNNLAKELENILSNFKV